MTDPQPSEQGSPALLAEWQAFIDAMFPQGMWAQDVTDIPDRAPRRLFPTVVVLDLNGEFPVLLGQEYMHDVDIMMPTSSWAETEVAGKYAARVQVGGQLWELRSGVPPVLLRPESRKQAEVDRAMLEQRRQLDARSRVSELTGLELPEDLPEVTDGEIEAAFSAPMVDPATGVVVPAPLAAQRSHA